ncbi:DUF3887 domain-containing protein [Lacisediminihabitans sp.]|uniref:DUF3887 domain-containing protein n=1 Tax=Lacisediminihabitans sp. TaxID=2787631 RepID=UPI00374D2127
MTDQAQFEGIRAALQRRADADAALAEAVDEARASGLTWQAVGDALGTSRQAAFQRFGRPLDPRTGEPMNTTPQPRAAERAAEAFAHLAANRPQAVVDEFDDTMRSHLDVDKLAAAWAQVAALVGAFERQGEPFARAADTLTVVDVPLAFEAGDMVGRIAFDPSGAIAGLFLLTPAAAGEL